MTTRRPSAPGAIDRAAQGRVVPPSDHVPFSVLGELDALLADDEARGERVDQALALVRRGLRTYLDAVGVIVVALDLRGRVLFVNRRGCELLGCAERHILGTDWIGTFVPERSRADTRSVLTALWNGEVDGVAVHENEIVTRSGAERTVAWRNEVLRDGTGAVWAVVGTGVDVTEQRRTERRLARVGKAVEAAHDGIGIIDTKGRIVYMNPALCAMTGYTLDELAAAGGPQALFASPVAGQRLFLWTMQDGSWSGETEMRSRDGHAMTVLLRASVIRDDRGQALGVVGIHTDVTDQKRVENALQRSEARNRALIEAIPDVILLFTSEGIVQDVHMPDVIPPPLRAVASGRSVHDVLPPDLAALLVRESAARTDSCEPHAVSFTSEGRTYVVETRVVSIERNGYLGILRDVTDRYRLESEVLRATDEERQRLGRDLHDGLGSHLVGLGMLVRGLARGARATAPGLAEELQEVARLVDEGAEQARALAHGLNPVNLDGQGPVVALERLAASTDAHTALRCTFDAPAAVPPLRSEVATQLYRIAQEAVTNALRHAEAEHIAITLDVERDAVVLTVRDDGRGLAGTPSPQERGLGLQTMAYRARIIGGTFDLREGAEGGLVVSCRVPRLRAGERPPSAARGRAHRGVDS